MQPQQSPLLQIAIEAAKVGAAVANNYYETSFTVEYKEDNSPVTIADKESEKAIKAFILSKDSSAQFVAEESGGDATADEFWIIDPVDGTRTFSRHLPYWCILIAYCKKGEIILGVCYFPLLDSMLYAERGCGAYLNGEKVSVSNITDSEEVVFGHNSIRFYADITLLPRLAKAFGASRGYDATYNLFLVAIGKLEAHIDPVGKLWDIAPFKVIVEEAGGKVSSFEGKKWTTSNLGCIASNKLLHQQVIEIVSQKK